MLDLALLRSFVAVAETEHVGRAATALHISQSPLSRHIRRLERELGVTLFHREKRRIRLTAAGRSLVGPARELLGRAAAFEREAAQRAKGQTARLAIGCVQTALWSNVVQRAVRSVQRTWPNIHVEVATMSSARQVEALAEERIDVALLHRPPAAENFSVREILREPLRVALPRSHRLSRVRAVRPADLAGETWVVLARTLAPDMFDRLYAAAADAGLNLLVRHEVSDRSTQLAFVASGLGVALVPESGSAAGGRGVVLRPLQGAALYSRLFLAHASSLSPPAAHLVAALHGR